MDRRTKLSVTGLMDRRPSSDRARRRGAGCTAFGLSQLEPDAEIRVCPTVANAREAALIAREAGS